MLEDLLIRNYALIESLELHFSKGFVCLTGETGAGKSILAGALGLLHGDRGDKSLIRSGHSEASVSASFSLPEQHGVFSWLEENELPLDDSNIVLRRILRTSGSSRCYIQGQPVTRAQLAECASFLFEMHGQHEHQVLFNPKEHRSFVDGYGRTHDLLDEYRRVHRELTVLKERYNATLMSESERKERLAKAEATVEELEAAGIILDEEHNLHNERELLVHHEKIAELLATSLDRLSGEEQPILSNIKGLIAAMDELSTIDPSLEEASSRINSAFYELEDVHHQLAARAADMDYNPARLEEIEKRLATLERLFAKYGQGSAELLACLERAREDLENLDQAGDSGAKLREELIQVERDLVKKGRALSQARSRAAAELEQEVMGILARLGMAKASFSVSIQELRNERAEVVCGPHGIDGIEFLLAANPGEPAKPLIQVASGGEMSRVTLALKVVLDAVDPVPTLIFDEVDAGIGGEVAKSVGSFLGELARNKQVFSITHLASIAAMANEQVLIAKEQLEDVTFTNAHILDRDQRVAEIARMLAGDGAGEASISYARELLASN